MTSFENFKMLIDVVNKQIDSSNEQMDNHNKQMESFNKFIADIIMLMKEERKDVVDSDDESTVTDIDDYETAHEFDVEETVNDNIGLHSCQLCDFTTRHKQSINNHILHKHNNIRKFRCNFEGCDKFFKTKKCLSQHRYTHRTTKIKCDKCEKEYQHPSGLYAHKKRIHKLSN